MIRHPITAIIGGLARGRVRRQTIRELNALSDRQLADIGIERAAISAIVDARLNTIPVPKTPVAKTMARSWNTEESTLGGAITQSA
ncbi:MAG: DUF1127 domain-containing protein [Gammaproteobacteria bacterium]|nr:DUF1127 domain-containing protein [Gammaproteobacteria bacterium]